MPSSPVHNAGLPKANKCRLILESFSMNAPVAARYFGQKQAIAVCIVHMQISIVRPNREKHKIESTERMIDNLVSPLSRTCELIDTGSPFEYPCPLTSSRHLDRTAFGVVQVCPSGGCRFLLTRAPILRDNQLISQEGRKNGYQSRNPLYQ